MSSKPYPSPAAAFTLSALLMLLTLGTVSCKSKQQAPPQMPPPEVSVIKLSASPVTISEEYVGQTEAKDTVEIRARVGGILEKQAFEDGAHVKKGQLLYVIDQQPYIVALAQAKAALAQATAAHLNAQQVLDRARPLADAQAISKQDLDSAVAGERTAAAQVEVAEAGVRQAELNLGYTTITAPQNGDISSSLVRVGSMISPSIAASTTLMATLYSIDPMYVNTTISEERLLALNRQYGGRLGRDIKSSPAIKVLMVDGSTYPYPAHINYFGPSVDKQTGTLTVRVSVPNPDRMLRPGQFVRLVLPERTIKEGITVPLQSVQQLQEIKTVLVVGPDDVVQPRTITGSNTVGNELVVDSGLSAGETIIVEGTAKVRPGMKVKPVPMPAAEGGPAGAAPQKKAEH